MHVGSRGVWPAALVIDDMERSMLTVILCLEGERGVVDRSEWHVCTHLTRSFSIQRTKVRTTTVFHF
jgi:hypothetical protein